MADAVNEQIFDCGYLIADLARHMTFLPGDILLTGTPANSRPLEVGDTIDIEVTGVGRRSNKVVETPAPRAKVGFPSSPTATAPRRLGQRGAPARQVQSILSPEDIMVAIKVADFAFPRMEAPDLDEMEEFLTHFGLVRAERTPDSLYMRGTDSPHHLHAVHKGDTKFIGFAYHAASEDDLKRVAKLPGASGIETVNEPGGGKRVRLTEPNGYQIEVIHGMQSVPPIKVERDFLNSGSEPRRRVGRLMRLSKSPTPIQRIGHGVLSTPKVKETVAWFRETLGMIRSDDVYAGEKENVIGAFSRLDSGDDYVDHHVLFCIHNEKTGLNHVSYEAHDIDAIFQDHEYLKKLGKYEHMWGIGRHLLGSQVFDYWSDPWGRVHERWADTDRLNAANGGNLLRVEEGFQLQWGDRPPDRFIGHASP